MFTWDDFGKCIWAAAGQTLPSAFIAPLLSSVLELKSQEQQMLEQIGAKLEYLLRGPFYTGLEYLIEAGSPDRTPDRRDELIEKARDRFLDAFGHLQGDHMWAAISALHIGVCDLMLGRRTDAERRISQAYAILHDYLLNLRSQDFMPAITNSFLGSMLFYAGTGFVGATIVAHRAVTKTRKIQVNALAFLETLAEIQVAFGARPDSFPKYVVVEWPSTGDSRPAPVCLCELRGSRVDMKGKPMWERGFYTVYETGKFTASIPVYTPNPEQYRYQLERY